MWKFWPTKKGLQQCLWTKDTCFLVGVGGVNPCSQPNRKISGVFFTTPLGFQEKHVQCSCPVGRSWLEVWDLRCWPIWSKPTSVFAQPPRGKEPPPTGWQLAFLFVGTVFLGICEVRTPKKYFFGFLRQMGSGENGDKRWGGWCQKKAIWVTKSCFELFRQEMRLPRGGEKDCWKKVPAGEQGARQRGKNVLTTSTVWEQGVEQRGKSR